MNNRFNISEENKKKIIISVNNIPQFLQIQPNEKTIGASSLPDSSIMSDGRTYLDVINNLNKIRRDYGYQFSSEPITETEKNWGKIVFISIHTTVIRFDNHLNVTSENFYDEFLQCLTDIVSSDGDALKVYCGMYNNNPYFGEFDDIIKSLFTIELIDN